MNRTIIAACLLHVSPILAGASVAEQSDPSLQIPLGQQSSAPILELRHVPHGFIPKEPPSRLKTDQPSTSSAVSSTPNALPTEAKNVEIFPFYISVSEVTFAQLRAVLDEKTIDRISERIRKTCGKENQYLIDAIKSDDFPAFAISFDEATAFCLELNNRASKEAELNAMSIEGRSFRIPTHFEWQYACRAVQDVKDVAELPHLNQWVAYTALEKNESGMIEDQWEKYGRPKPELGNGSQFVVFEMIEARLGSEDAHGIPEKILTAYFSKCLGRRNFSAPGGKLFPVRQAKPNRWGIHDMQGNVCEWVLSLETRSELATFWKEAIETKTPSTKACLLLAGGGFSQAISAKGAWKDFAIWGAYPMNRQTGIVEPMSLEKGRDSSARGIAAENNPGLRVVLDRIIRPEWFHIVRAASQKKSPPEVYTGFRKSVAEIATPEESSRLEAFVNAYEAVARFRNNDRTQATPRLARASESLAKSGEGKKQQSAADRLKAALSRSKDSSPKKPADPAKGSDDSLFFSVATNVYQ